MPHNDRLRAEFPEYVRDAPGSLALAASRPDSRHRDDGLRRRQHRRVDVERRKRHAVCFDPPASCIDVREADIGVGEYHFVHVAGIEQHIQFGLGVDRYAFGIERAGEFRGIPPVLDVRNLCSGEREDVEFGPVAKAAVEDMEVASRSSHDHEVSAHRNLCSASVPRVSYL